MTVNSSTQTPATTGSTTSGSSSSSSSSSSTSASSTISENQFLTLLTEQLENQDPLQPEDDTQFLSQMAQFTTLQQTNTLTSQIQQMAAATYMGADVTMSSNGSTVTGQVTGVDTSGSTPNLILNGSEYPITSLQLIQSPMLQAASSSSTGSSAASTASTAASTAASSSTTPTTSSSSTGS